MPTNIEIKFRVRDLATIETNAAACADSGPELIIQEDIFFPVASGRLKLRKFADGRAELIGYQRLDSESIRESKWLSCPTTDPDTLEKVLESTLGKGLVVRKSRTLYMVGNSRIHLDQVEGLGEFVEIEVVLGDNDCPDSGTKVASDLVRALGLEEEQRVAVAYVDLLANKQ